MNWRRGLLRAWIIAGAMWTTITLWITIRNLQTNFPNELWRLAFWEPSVIPIMAPWLLLAALYAVRWIYKGFSA